MAAYKAFEIIIVVEIASLLAPFIGKGGPLHKYPQFVD
jgi:hypothetical protein